MPEAGSPPPVTHPLSVDEECGVESPGLRRDVSDEVMGRECLPQQRWEPGQLPGEVWEAQALRQRGRNPALALRLDTFGGLNKVLHSFTLLQAQAARKKQWAFILSWLEEALTLS